MWRLACAALLVAGSAAAQIPTAAPPTPTAPALVAALSGRWVGTLGSSPGSGPVQSQPMVAEIHGLSDNATVITVSSFQDAVQQSIVTVTDVALFDDRAGSVAVASFRKSQPVAVNTSTVAVAFTNILHWSITYISEGRDQDKPASIRVIQTRDGDTLTAIRAVRLKDSGADWVQRNISSLHRDTGLGQGESKAANQPVRR
jgi:hypothetical protein